MKLFDVFNFLAKYSGLEIIYEPKLEIKSHKTNNPFYNSTPSPPLHNHSAMENSNNSNPAMPTDISSVPSLY